MKETKVYMNNLPIKCRDCPCCNCEYENGLTCNLGAFDDEYYLQHISMFDKKKKHRNCPLIDIKTHDRELVKEVCEKIRKELDGDYNQYRINHILDQIQGEVEKLELVL